MFAGHEVALELQGTHRLEIRCRAMRPLLERKAPRARWRPRLFSPQTLRLYRTSLLGHMGGWCPPVAPIGPWRDIRLVARADLPGDARLATRCEGADGIIEVAVRSRAQQVRLICADRSLLLTRGDEDLHTGTLRVSDARRWWPHTHGRADLYEVCVSTDGHDHSLGRVGFRTIEIDRDGDGEGFGLVINGVPVFCRGAVWTSADLVALDGSRNACEPLLRQARDAGMNMLRIGGTMTYETRAFFDLCDELGLLVWQDFMFASADYPDGDPAFIDRIRTEADHVLREICAAPSLAVLCGGSEIAQQAAMMGHPPALWSNAIFDDVLKVASQNSRPDVPYIANTPGGGSLPFEPRRGICHYYGVSAYMRPISDARSAQVRFAAECLGFANVPDGSVALAPDVAAIVQPLWGTHYDRDVNAVWFFEEVRNHYLRELYDIDPGTLRREDPDRYLDLSRAVTAEVAQEVFSLWRAAGSTTRGGLVWFLKDLSPGAGFGVLDFDGAPKAIWHGLSRVLRPVQLLLTDEGLNGLDLHLINESAADVRAKLSLCCLRDGATPVMQAGRQLSLAARSVTRLPATDLWGAFFDTACSYRFGPPSHDITLGRLVSDSGELLSEAFHSPLGRGHERHDLGLRADLLRDEHGWSVTISCVRFAQSVHLVDPHWRADRDWFHLPPGEARHIRLIARSPGARDPNGHIAAINGIDRAVYGIK